MALAEVHDQGIAAEDVERLVEQKDVAHRLGHLGLLQANHPVVDPQPRQRRSPRGAGLGGLVLVVGEDQIRAAPVDV